MLNVYLMLYDSEPSKHLRKSEASSSRQSGLVSIELYTYEIKYSSTSIIQTCWDQAKTFG